MPTGKAPANNYRVAPVIPFDVIPPILLGLVSGPIAAMNLNKSPGQAPYALN
jgi:hypothetical protein